VDYSKPLLAQVARMGEAYDAWVLEPRAETRSTTLFANAAIERASKTHWSAVMMFWLPVISKEIASGFGKIRAREGGMGEAFAAFLAFACAMWPTFEYVVHRFAFHGKSFARRRRGVWNQAHYLFHGCHHKHPNDLLRLVFPLTVSAPVGYVAYVACARAFPSGTAEFAAAGFHFGYFMYDMTHYAVHGDLFGLGDGALRRRRAAHLRHHYDDHTRGFGVTTSALDAAFGTLARATATKTRS